MMNMMICVIQNDDDNDDEQVYARWVGWWLKMSIADRHIRQHTLHIHTALSAVSLSYSRLFRRSLFSASVVIRLRSRFATAMRDAHAWPVSSVFCCGFPLEVNLTLLQVQADFQLFFVAFPLSASFPPPSHPVAGSFRAQHFPKV